MSIPKRPNTLLIPRTRRCHALSQPRGWRRPGGGPYCVYCIVCDCAAQISPAPRPSQAGHKTALEQHIPPTRCWTCLLPLNWPGPWTSARFRPKNYAPRAHGWRTRRVRESAKLARPSKSLAPPSSHCFPLHDQPVLCYSPLTAHCPPLCRPRAHGSS
jgi:hypothetical protein